MYVQYVFLTLPAKDGSSSEQSPKNSDNQLGQHFPDTMINVVAAVFGVSEQGAPAPAAAISVAAVVGEEGHGDRRVRRAVARPARVKLVQRRLGQDRCQDPREEIGPARDAGRRRQLVLAYLEADVRKTGRPNIQPL